MDQQIHVYHADLQRFIQRFSNTRIAFIYKLRYTNPRSKRITRNIKKLVQTIVHLNVDMITVGGKSLSSFTTLLSFPFADTSFTILAVSTYLVQRLLRENSFFFIFMLILDRND